MLKPAVERHLARRAGEPGEYSMKLVVAAADYFRDVVFIVSSLSRWTPRLRTDFEGWITVRSSTNPANLVTIGPVDVHMIGLTEPLKKK